MKGHICSIQALLNYILKFLSECGMRFLTVACKPINEVKRF